MSWLKQRWEPVCLQMGVRKPTNLTAETVDSAKRSGYIFSQKLVDGYQKVLSDWEVLGMQDIGTTQLKNSPDNYFSACICTTSRKRCKSANTENSFYIKKISNYMMLPRSTNLHSWLQVATSGAPHAVGHQPTQKTNNSTHRGDNHFCISSRVFKIALNFLHTVNVYNCQNYGIHLALSLHFHVCEWW